MVDVAEDSAVSGPKRCPKCRLWSHPEALRCDCGYDFVGQKVERSYLADGTNSGPGSRYFDDLAWGEVWLVVLAPVLALCVALYRLRRGRRGGKSMGVLAIWWTVFLFGSAIIVGLLRG